MGRQLGCVSLWGGGAGSPSNTMWPGPRPTCMPSFILIRPTVSPQCTNVTDRQTGQDRQRSDTIGRTVLQTVAKKTKLKPTVDCKNCSYVSAYHCAQLPYTTQHRTVLIVFHIVLQTVIIAQILSTGGAGQIGGSGDQAASGIGAQSPGAVWGANNPQNVAVEALNSVAIATNFCKAPPVTAKG